MDSIKDFLQDYWYISLALLAIVLIMLVIICVLACKLRQAKAVAEYSAHTHTAQNAEHDDDIEVIEQTDTVEIKAKGNTGYVLTFDRTKSNWIIRKKGVERATRRAKTKEEAIKIAKELSRKHNVSLVVKKKDGKFQKQR